MRKYETGMVKLPPSPEHLLYLAIMPRTQSGWDQFSVLDTEIDGVGKLQDVVAWMSQDGEEIRYVIGGTSHQITALRKAVHKAIKLGDVVDQKGFKIKRE